MNNTSHNTTFHAPPFGRHPSPCIAACGMNFCYSGQIIALAQYFDKKQSIATSGAMVGIGVGMFFTSSGLEYVIENYGWRVSYLVNAAVSLHIAVLGALVFPIQDGLPRDPSIQGQTTPGSISTVRGIPTSRSRAVFEKTLNDRSFSSLRLSAGASYLSHSVLSLGDNAPVRRYSTYNRDPGITSNQHSFCSRSGMRSNQQSFCMRDSQAELSFYELRPNMYSFHHTNADSQAPSRNPSFTRRESTAGMGMTANPLSFVSRASHIELPHCHQDVEVDRGQRAKFLIREGDCDLSCCVEDLEEPCASHHHQSTWREERGSLCLLLAEKVKRRLHRSLAACKISSDHPLRDPRMWLMNFSVLLCMVGTLTLYIIYKDYAESVGLSDYYTMALSGIGIGDLCGRMSTGLVLTLKFVDAVFMYGVVILLCSVVMMGHLFVSFAPEFIALTATFGFFYGSMNVLIAVAPSTEFGKDKLVIVFGYILFFGGVGALVGAPLAGYIVDVTGSYAGVIWFSTLNLVSAASLMFLCFLISHRQRKKLPGVEI